jgi:hypothetical protein
MSNGDQSQARRVEALRNLISLNMPVEQAEAALAEFGWDSDDDLDTLTRVDATQILRRYRAGELTRADCQRWAQALEGREDLGFEDGWEDTLKELLFEIATPELSEPLTPEFANRWEIRLSRQS